MRQNLGGERHGDALDALRQEQRELYRERERLALASVVGDTPVRYLGVEHRLEGELREASFYVSRGGGAVARQYVSPVTLRVDEQLLLSQLHQGVADRGVAVGMVLHGVAHDVGYLVVSAVVEGLHGVEDAALHRLQTVVDIGHRTLQYNVAGILKIPVAKHTRQLMRIVVANEIGNVF